MKLRIVLLTAMTLVLFSWVRSYYIRDNIYSHNDDGSGFSFSVSRGAIYICRQFDSLRPSFPSLSFWTQPPDEWEGNYGVPTSRWLAIRYFLIRRSVDKVFGIMISHWLIEAVIAVALILHAHRRNSQQKHLPQP